MRKTLLSFLLMMIQVILFAQSKEITGTIKDAKSKEPIVGAMVKVEGVTGGVAADVNGEFKINVDGEGKQLIISFIGYKTQKIAADKSPIEIALEEDALNLNEVVVTAIGIKKEKKAIGYSVQEVSGDDVTKADNTNLVGGLGGKIAGVQVTSSSGVPGSSAFIKLRGTTSLTGNNQPLIVVDGVPFNNDENRNGDGLGGVAYSNRGIDINPNDIESISVLKGPAASALYGISASNGVLVITTKKGSNSSSDGTNQLHLTFSSSLSFDHVTQLPPIQMLYSQGSGGKYQDPSSGTPYSWGAKTDTLYWDGNSSYKWDSHGKIVGQNDPTKKNKFVPYNNMEQFFRPSMTYDNSIALTGGGQSGTFRLSASHMENSGVVPLTNFSRSTVSLAADQKISSKFHASGSVTYSNSGGRRAQQGSNTSGLMLGLARTPNSFDNSNGKKNPEDSTAYIFSDGKQRNYRGGGGYDNPYFTINQNIFRDNVNRMFGSAQIDYSALEWLNITYRLGTDFYGDSRKQYYAIGSRLQSLGQIWEDRIMYQHINSDLMVTANKKFSDNLQGSLMIGNNIYGQSTNEIYTQGDGLNFPGFYDISNATDVISQAVLNRKRMIGFYGKADVGYKNMVYFTLTGRQDRSSTLPLNHNKFFYPSSDLAFIFTEALGMSNNKILPFGKVRISYAQVGKDAPIYSTQNYYTSATFLDGWTNGVAFPFNGIGGFAYNSLLGNPNLKPERTNSFELGTDLRFINNRIALDITYYISKSIDQIFLVPISGSTGFTNMMMNAGSIQNKGLEIALMTTPVKIKDFRWDLNFNWSMNRNKVLVLADGVDNLFINGFTGASIRAVVGQPYGQIYGGRWLRDKDGNVIIDDKPGANYGKPVADDKVGVIGNTNPKWLGGIVNTFSYKRLSLSGLISIKHGGDIWNGTKGALITMGTSKFTENRGTTTVFDGVKQSNGQKNDINTTLNEAWYEGNGGGFGAVAEQFIEDGSYIKLKELSLSYSLNPKYLTKVHISGLDFSVFGRNLWIKTKYTGVDPETSLAGASNAQGMDYFNMPGVRTWGVKLRLTL